MSRSKARNYRALAAECERQSELAVAEPQFREMQATLARAYVALAESEEWLEGAAPLYRRNEQQAMRAA
jgi:hypothetical protein